MILVPILFTDNSGACVLFDYTKIIDTETVLQRNLLIRMSDRSCWLLLDAAEEGNLERINSLLEDQYYLKMILGNANEVFRTAVKHGHLPVVERLIQIPEVRQTVTANYNNALCVACENGDLNMVNRLLDFPEVLSYATINENEPLRIATEKNHAKIVERLCQEKAVRDYEVNENQLKFNNIFLRADENWSEQTLHELSTLLDAGVNPNIYIKLPNYINYLSPLMISMDLQHIELFRVLVEKGADPFLPGIHYYLNKRSENTDFTSMMRSIFVDILPVAFIASKLNSQCNPVLEEMYQTLNYKMTEKVPEFYSNIIACFKDVYVPIFESINVENKIAHMLGKKLLILIGEAHNSEFSLFIEEIVALIACDLFNVDQFTLELPSEWEKYRGILTYNMVKLDKFVESQWQKKCIYIDNGRSSNQLTASVEMLVSEEQMHNRNQVMHQELIERKMRMIVSIVGTYHLYGLMKENLLTNDFHVLALNTYREEKKPEGLTEYLIRCHDFAESAEIFQLTEPPYLMKLHQCLQGLMSQENVMNIWYEIGQQLKPIMQKEEFAKEESHHLLSESSPTYITAKVKSAEADATLSKKYEQVGMASQVRRFSNG